MHTYEEYLETCVKEGRMPLRRYIWEELQQGLAYPETVNEYPNDGQEDE